MSLTTQRTEWTDEEVQLAEELAEAYRDSPAGEVFETIAQSVSESKEEMA